MAEATSLLLGLEGLEVRAVSRQVDRVRVVDVVTADRRGFAVPGLPYGVAVGEGSRGHPAPRSPLWG